MRDAPHSTSERIEAAATMRRLHDDERRPVVEGSEEPSADAEPANATQPSWVRFDAGHLAIVIADAPDLSELTHAQFQLAGLRAVEGASGVEFLDGKAWIRLVLEESINVDMIARTLQRTFGGTIHVEAALPDERRVHLRHAPAVAAKREEQPIRSRLWLRP